MAFTPLSVDGPVNGSVVVWPHWDGHGRRAICTAWGWIATPRFAWPSINARARRDYCSYKKGRAIIRLSKRKVLVFLRNIRLFLFSAVFFIWWGCRCKMTPPPVVLWKFFRGKTPVADWDFFLYIYLEQWEMWCRIINLKLKLAEHIFDWWVVGQNICGIE